MKIYHTCSHVSVSITMYRYSSFQIYTGWLLFMKTTHFHFDRAAFYYRRARKSIYIGVWVVQWDNVEITVAFIKNRLGGVREKRDKVLIERLLDNRSAPQDIKPFCLVHTQELAGRGKKYAPILVKRSATYRLYTRALCLLIIFELAPGEKMSFCLGGIGKKNFFTRRLRSRTKKT